MLLNTKKGGFTMIQKISSQNLLSILVIGLVIVIIILILVGTKSYFNSSELNLLIEKATENNLDYEVIIQNKLTNSYYFNIIN